jgi:hypothetical protein
MAPALQVAILLFGAGRKQTAGLAGKRTLSLEVKAVSIASALLGAASGGRIPLLQA